MMQGAADDMEAASGCVHVLEAPSERGREMVDSACNRKCGSQTVNKLQMSCAANVNAMSRPRTLLSHKHTYASGLEMESLKHKASFFKIPFPVDFQTLNIYLNV